uniref:Uncharacterized protein n=1 Tax=Oryza brachyantha TaxID=4533 RepID=J3N099_ORYBR
MRGREIWKWSRLGFGLDWILQDVEGGRGGDKGTREGRSSYRFLRRRLKSSFLCFAGLGFWVRKRI